MEVNRRGKLAKFESRQVYNDQMIKSCAASDPRLVENSVTWVWFWVWVD